LKQPLGIGILSMLFGCFYLSLFIGGVGINTNII
jgi:hypothetical protein